MNEHEHVARWRTVQYSTEYSSAALWAATPRQKAGGGKGSTDDAGGQRRETKEIQHGTRTAATASNKQNKTKVVCGTVCTTTPQSRGQL